MKTESFILKLTKIKRMNRKSLFYSFLLLFSAILCEAQEDCVYNDKSFTNDFLKQSEFIFSYAWDNEKKEGAALLNDGSTLIIKRWACNHIGTSASLMVNKEHFDISSWRYYTKNLAMIVCNDFEMKLVDKGLNKYASLESLEKRQCRKEMDISNEIYPEFYISISELEDTVIISIFFYKIP